ncbi:lecithin retinol acyltransferase family protein [Cyanobacterium sp. DS4]|uniref:lecithin retinol acyltransferase family protein n=1 Tax=Cyanobacterium sp. DS4 TaxID=2878255 RepID=UPI002E8174F5|nr:lecithin retinol acyltransferase family protein [Cyanobacterium sp. Dongsha4]WVL02437.1 lecithin retinol acyltransferase family protein [Cyanobacterium sp. Dongsha4]
MAFGDQIYVWRNFRSLEGVYQHHGIDVGDGSVIHYRKPSEIIEQTSWDTFSRGNSVYMREYPQGFTFIPEVVVKRAFTRLGENKYNLVFNNCEHFATWCKTGVSESQQVKDFIPTINRLDTFNLFEPLKNAFQGSNDINNSQHLLEDALGKIRVVWEQIQPQYQEALTEIDTWQKVAVRALQNNREDLAREALTKKKSYEKKAKQLEIELEKLAVMTENLLKNKNII